MKKFAFVAARAFAALTLIVGTLSATAACHGPYYQPQVPDKLKKAE